MTVSFVPNSMNVSHQPAQKPFDDEMKRTLIKEVVLGFFLLLSAIACGWAFRQILDADSVRLFVWPPRGVSYLFLLPLVFSMVFSVFILAVANMRVRVSSVTVSAIALHVFFPFQSYFVGSIILAAALMLLADWEAKTEYHASTKIFIRKIVGRNLGYFFTGVALSMSFLYYSTLPLD